MREGWGRVRESKSEGRRGEREGEREGERGRERERGRKGERKGRGRGREMGTSQFSLCVSFLLWFHQSQLGNAKASVRKRTK